ncbi:MAG: transcription antitermination factor NusB [Candidatus Rokubacteria bacterium RIFCSPHIGHO2_12_FULL_73_22]|nr:MAG: transcription antitermination factor NusB [Candidatus Rokubacteria bacterium RIFCSPHIGHO2_12_FULL_73_22]OGL01432.1 MAG: transcription antitermination factor NusB [Candidatus Rokubacteria bacterium RIFCSPHIGHO2_02_FULL_73_26]OGL09535.1 MAG: transcription antitermination factor NusB [Candidatus Rokubacteria bacterium RIFCSPLOWO2_02_FULL_73_56]OGL26806.1 MAG: transcription antitermination factor NusB [Candidatus Rokubacteria bacterium RIFCSPLOWO2_12_FULL_73_47]
MTRRRKAREIALQFLYQLDLVGDENPAPHAEEFWARHPVDTDGRAFADALVYGTKAHQAEIDRLIARSAEHWDLDRMAVVDRNILRLAIWELLWHGEVPPKVAINEAIEMAKKFGTKESSRFINGVLDRIHKEARSAS